MKILFICCYYPPLELGGWDQLVQELIIRLSKRGHGCAILTSNYQANELTLPEPNIHRLLQLESPDTSYYHAGSFLHRFSYERENFHHLENIIRNLQPEILFIHSMWNLPRSLAWHAEHLMPNRTVYYLADRWPLIPSIQESYWRAPTRRKWLNPLKKLSAVLPLFVLEHQQRIHPLEFKRVICVSHAIRSELSQYLEIPSDKIPIINNGIDIEEFSPPSDWKPGNWRNTYPAFLYAGSIIPVKGVDTAIQGFAQAIFQSNFREAILTIIGHGDLEYINALKQQTVDLGIDNRVFFKDWIDRSEMPDILKQFDILLMPSQHEALSRMMQEAMACGLIVIGTTSGGSEEILIEGSTGLTFMFGDSSGLAHQIKRVLEYKEIRTQLAQNGRQLVIQKFNITRMVDEIEGYLFKCNY
jgi:glycosyltransferase involved in cell wall biosynthesis